MQKGTWASSEREPHLWEVSILQKGTVVLFSRSSCLLGPVTFLCHLWLICLSTLPWGVDTYPSQDESQSEAFWEDQDSLWPGIIL